jgi:hypothetical protein
MEHWRDLYTAAVLECDPDKLQDYVRAAEQAIRQRSTSMNGQISREEQLEMQDALSALRVLRREHQKAS